MTDNLLYYGDNLDVLRQHILPGLGLRCALLIRWTYTVERMRLWFCQLGSI